MTIQTAPTYASIPLKTPHDRTCIDREWYYGRQVGERGDVRRCPEHNKLQILMHNEGFYWFTPSPILEPILYRRVKKAWEGAQK